MIENATGGMMHHMIAQEMQQRLYDTTQAIIAN